MADNTPVTNGAGDTYRSKDRAGVKTDIVGLDVGIGTGTELLLSTINAMPVEIVAGDLGVAAVRPDSVFRAAGEPGALLYDTFDVAADVNKWTVQGTVPPVQANGALTVSAGTVASAWSAQTSVAAMNLTINSYLTPNILLATEATAKTGTYRFVGLGVLQGSPTAAAPLVNAVGFEWDPTTGLLSGAVWSNSVRTLSVSLSSFQPADTNNHRYLLYFKTSKVYFEIDGVPVGSIAYPNPNISNLPMVIANINGLSTVTPAAVFVATFLGVADSAGHDINISDPIYPWRQASVGKSGGLSVKGTSPTGQTLAVVATTPITGAGLDVSEAGNVTFVVKNTVAATAFTGVPVIVFEQSDDNVQWAPLPVAGATVSSSPVIATGASNTEQMFDAGMEGVNWVRVRVTTAQTANGMTVVTIPGGMPFSPFVAIAGIGKFAIDQTTDGTTNMVSGGAIVKGTADAHGFTMQPMRDCGRVSVMLTATVASTAATETLITLTKSLGLAGTTTGSSLAITSGKKFRIQSITASARNTTGTTLGIVTVRLRGAVAGATTNASPLQFSTSVALTAAINVSVLFPSTQVPDGFEIDSNAGTNTFGVTILHPQWVTGSVVATFDISIIGYEY
jgi:hypothetical protein